MSNTPQLNGQKGEVWAQDFLQAKGYHILASNWRFSRAEVDLIAEHGDLIVFIEVKMRSSEVFGRPEAFVDRKKQRLLAAAAAAFCEQRAHFGEIRFDVISILLDAHGQPQIAHLTDAFFPGLA